MPTKPRLGAIFASNHSLELRIGSDRVFLLILKYDRALGLFFRKIKFREFSTHFYCNFRFKKNLFQTSVLTLGKMGISNLENFYHLTEISKNVEKI